MSSGPDAGCVREPNDRNMLTLQELGVIKKALDLAERAVNDEGYTLRYEKDGPHCQALKLLARERRLLKTTPQE